MQPAQTSLCRLPSGVLRWQRPALLSYPDVETRQQIWQMQCSLATPTDTNNLAQRLFLTRCWTDLMTLEGFTGLPRAWSATMDNLHALRLATGNQRGFAGEMIWGGRVRCWTLSWANWIRFPGGGMRMARRATF